MLLQEMISHKTQVKLDELLRRLSLGLNHNQEASNKYYIFCYEIYMMSKEMMMMITKPMETQS